MNRCSFFIKNHALFGSYPSQKSMNELEANGVRYIVDLTVKHERNIVPYTTTLPVIKYPIRDMHVPRKIDSFARLVLKICRIIRGLKNDEKIYIHCKGGHGRSGIVVAAVLCHLYGMTPPEALRLTSYCHGMRKEMRSKWRAIGSPQTQEQKYFVSRFFEPLNYYKAYSTGNKAGLSNYSRHPVETRLGGFPTAVAAYEAEKCPTDLRYVNLQKNADSPIASKYYGRVVRPRRDWMDVRVGIMYDIVLRKFSQNKDARQNLLNTGLRPLIFRTDADSFWGDGVNGKGKNMLGKIMNKVRAELLEIGDKIF